MIDEKWVKQNTDHGTKVVSLDADDVLEVLAEVRRLTAALRQRRWMG